MLSIRWSTTAELSNRHSSCRAVSSSIRVAGGGKREDTARLKVSQRFSMGLRSVEYAGYAIRAIPSLSRGTQTRGTWAYSPFMCNLRRTVAADIALPIDAVTLDVTRVEVALRFRLATIAIYRSSAGVVTLGRPPTGLRTTVYVV
ncbi:uncharacterized protein TNCV_503931 [Trichonephila clavipes]|nr:uncharacterized protein TNCV_503931 [Trichonephila clavipes]